MLACRVFVAVPVVSGDAGHELLERRLIGELGFRQELGRRHASQRRREPAVMAHVHLAALGGAPRESKVAVVARRHAYFVFPAPAISLAADTPYSGAGLPMSQWSNQRRMCCWFWTRWLGMPLRESSWFSPGKRTMTTGFFW